MHPGTKRRVKLFVSILVLIAAGGALLGSATGRVPLIGAVTGALNGIVVLGTIVAAEIFLPQTRLGRALERASFLTTFALRWLVYHALIVIVIGSGMIRGL